MAYVYTASQIYIQTINFLSRISARYSRLIASDIASLASEVLANAEKANNIYPSSPLRQEMREQHLIASRAALSALDVHLSYCYDIMLTNPEGCFEKTNNGTTAKKKLDNLAQTLGELIDTEYKLLTGVLKSDKQRN